MLLRLRLKNFQCHRRLDIKFKQAVTVITGKSDSGKSAIVRALRWVLLNAIPGKGFVTQGETEAMVSAEFDTFAVTRRRTASKNLYRLTLDDEGRQHFDFASFAASVPEPIRRELLMSSENIQAQHDAPFWLTLSDTQAAAQLNSIVRLDAVDTSISRLLSQRNQAQARLTAAESSRAIINRKLTQVVQVPAERFDELEELLKRQSTARRFALASRIASVHEAREIASLAPAIESLEDRAESLEELTASNRKKGLWAVALRKTLRDLNNATSTHSAATDSLADLETELSSIKVCPECQQPLKQNRSR